MLQAWNSFKTLNTWLSFFIITVFSSISSIYVFYVSVHVSTILNDRTLEVLKKIDTASDIICGCFCNHNDSIVLVTDNKTIEVYSLDTMSMTNSTYESLCCCASLILGLLKRKSTTSVHSSMMKRSIWSTLTRLDLSLEPNFQNWARRSSSLDIQQLWLQILYVTCCCPPNYALDLSGQLHHLQWSWWEDLCEPFPSDVQYSIHLFGTYNISFFLFFFESCSFILCTFIKSLCSCPEKENILSGSGDGSIILWDIETGKKVHSVVIDEPDVYNGLFIKKWFNSLLLFWTRLKWRDLWNPKRIISTTSHPLSIPSRLSTRVISLPTAHRIRVSFYSSLVLGVKRSTYCPILNSLL